MTDTINVPRDLLERIVGKCKLSVLGDDHAKVWELLAAAPKAELQPLTEPVGEMRLSELVDDLVIPVVPAELPVGTKLYAAPPLSDDVAKDAARWDMLVKIYDHVLTHPDSRKHDAEYGRYKAAIEAGLGITGAIDAAMWSKGE